MIHLRAMLVVLCAAWLLVGCASSGGGEFRPANARSQSSPSQRGNKGVTVAKGLQSRNPSTPLSKRQPRPVEVSLTPVKAGRPVDLPGISADVDSMGKVGGGDAHGLSADQASALRAIEARLFAAEKALHKARENYAKISSGGALSADEDVGFRGFLAQLQSQLAASCMEFRRAGGHTQAHEIYCKAVFARALAVQTETKNVKRPASGQDSDKKAGALRTESGKERGPVSTALITARQTWKETAPSPLARRPSQQAPESEGAKNSLQRQSASSVAHSVGHRSAQPQSQGPYAGIPADIPDGQDDDVVARQLREAALAERDADLKAQLWNEYRKYKRGSG